MDVISPPAAAPPADSVLSELSLGDPEPQAAPSAEDENAFIEREGWTEYSHWHLGVDRDENGHTKKAYTFPFGDFRKLHRSGVISGESRAGQYDHDEIRDALKSLLELIDAE